MRILIPMYYLLVDLKLHHDVEVTGRAAAVSSGIIDTEKSDHHITHNELLTSINSCWKEVKFQGIPR